MPRATMEEEDQYKFEEDTPYRAKLLEVKDKRFQGTKNDREYDFTKWTWKWEIVEGDKLGEWAYGDTEDKLTTHPENKVRQWAEPLRGQPFEIGEGIDTDDLIGLEAYLTFKHRSYERNGETKYVCDIADVFPLSDDLSDPPF